MAPKPGKTANKKASGKHVVPDIDPNSSFTPESFEKELKALAAKAKDETWSKVAAEQGAIYLKVITLLTLAAVFANASQLALSPVYGSIPAGRLHAKLIAAACFVGWSSNLMLGRKLPIRPVLLLPVIAVYVPVVQYYLGSVTALTAYWGPLVTEGLTVFPVVALSAACVATYLDGADLSFLPSWMADAAPGLGSYGFFKGIEKVSAGFLQTYAGRTIFNTRIGLESVLAASYALIAPSKLLLFTLPAVLHTALFNTHVPTSMALASLNNTLGADGWVILDRQESITGYISVLDSVKDGFRVMRCDHSLLGGEWVKYIGKGQFKGNKVAEPIYGVFAMLEAVRLVELSKPIVDKDAKALVMYVVIPSYISLHMQELTSISSGLGIGTTPAALVAHGIDTTVVEIDPVVHQFALKYFQLPKKHTAVIEDAVSYTAKAANESPETYDYVVHDVFTGGAEPIALFTLEFLQNLNTLLKPEGVIAIVNLHSSTPCPP